VVVRGGFSNGGNDGDVVALGADVVGAGNDGDVDIWTILAGEYNMPWDTNRSFVRPGTEG
jgi:hypothetical protein